MCRFISKPNSAVLKALALSCALVFSLAACKGGGSGQPKTAVPLPTAAPPVDPPILPGIPSEPQVRCEEGGAPYEGHFDAKGQYRHPLISFLLGMPGRWLGNRIEFVELDKEPLQEVQLQSETLKLVAVTLPYDRLEKIDGVSLSLNSLRGSPIASDAIEIKVIKDQKLHFPMKVSEDLLDDDDEDSRDRRGEHYDHGKRKKVWVRRYQKVEVTVHLEKFIFGAGQSAAELLRESNAASGKAVFKIKGLNGFVKIYSGQLDLAGQFPGNCATPTPTPIPSPTASASPTPTATPKPNPSVSIDSASVGALTNNPQATFQFSSSEPVEFFCSVDGSAFNLCNSPFSTNILVDGNHSFTVYGTAADGRSSAPSQFSWASDATAPVVVIDSFDPGTALTSRTDFIASFSANELGQFECELDNAGFVACGSPFAYNQLADGTHKFSVRAIDNAGNTSSITSQSWDVKTTPPSVVVTSVIPAGNPTNSDNLAVHFEGANGAVTFSCQLDNGIQTGCSSPYLATGLSEGSHSINITAIDGAGNVSSAVGYSFVVDVTSPTVTISSIVPSANPTNSEQMSISFSASESAVFECNVDGGGYASCASPVVLVGLSSGIHEFAVRAIDPAGNVSSSVTSYSWTVDLVNPQISFISASPSAALFNQDSLVLNFSASEDSTFTCQLDGNAPEACASAGYQQTNLPDGSHRISVIATDRAGNASLPFLYDFAVDTVAPAVSFASIEPVSSLTSATSITFNFASEIGVNFECSLDGATWASCLSPIALSNLNDGTHSFSVRALDGAGNITAAPAQHAWSIDTVAPQTLIVSTNPNTSITAMTSISVDFSSNETGSSFECQLDGLGFTPCQSPASYNGLADGNHIFEVRARDAAGNIDLSSASYSWSILTAPLTISSVTVSSVTSTSAVVSWTTSIPANSQVAFAVSPSTTYSFTSVDPALVTSHSMTLSGLSKFTLYTVYAVSVDSTGRRVQSAVFSFRTAR